MLKKIMFIALILVLGSAFLPGLSAQEETTTTPLYVALVWHQHQPVYYKDPETNVYIRPWVRVHAAKSYLDMAALVEDYPDVHVTFNITPSLIRQLLDFQAGARDQYWVVTEIPAENLTDDDKRYLLERFFDASQRQIERFPRYAELRDSRDALGVEAAIAEWSAADFRDLQVLFNLSWTDPRWLAQEPLADLLARGRDFTEEDKAVLLGEHLRIIEEVLPYHARMQETGQIEVTMTPYAHPILPLLVDSNVAAVALPETPLPPQFVFGQDAVGQVNRGVELYQEIYGVAPRGMWPAEGSVSPGVIQMIANAGIQWIATDEEILARSLPDVEGFTRNSQDTIQQADALYRPYTVTGGRGGQVSIIFRDHRISDLIGFEYSGMSAEAAVADLMGRLENIQAQLDAEGAEGPHLVTILLDGENAWEYYENDGVDFLSGMYQAFSDSDFIQTVTPSEYLAMTDEPRAIEELWPGSWINPSFDTWIGEEEENLAWEYLLTMRMAVQEALPALDEATAEQVMDLVYLAEGSDWFWWYGSDQNAGEGDAIFDQQFRGYLERIYQLLGQDVPPFVYVPIIPEFPQTANREFTGEFTPTIDGSVSDDEWGNAAFYDVSGADTAFNGLYYGFDGQNLYLRLDAAASLPQDGTYGFYLSTPDVGVASPTATDDTTLLGFGAKRLLEVAFTDGQPSLTLYTVDETGAWVAGEAFGNVVVSDAALEIAAPLDVVSPALRGGDRLNVRVVAGETVLPPDGPMLAVVPDRAVPNVVLQVSDPEADDYGPGTYTYPTDAVFRPRAYDAAELIVGYDDESVILRVTMNGPLVNDWNAPNGMGILTLDVYIDVDGAGNGARLLLPGRNAALSADHAWDYAIFAEGWESAVFVPGEDGPVASNIPVTIVTSPGQRRITMRVPRASLPGEPSEWAYAVTVAGQEGFPAAGVLRIRDIEGASQQWRFGGNPGHSNATRLIDVIWPGDNTLTQETFLSTYPPSTERVDGLTPDDFAQIPMLTAEMSAE